jgi:hypothetical protein
VERRSKNRPRGIPRYLRVGSWFPEPSRGREAGGRVHSNLEVPELFSWTESAFEAAVHRWQQVIDVMPPTLSF